MLRIRQERDKERFYKGMVKALRTLRSFSYQQWMHGPANERGASAGMKLQGDLCRSPVT